MPWSRTSDDFADECWDLSSDAYRTHHEGITWSNRKLLDCLIPKSDIPRAVKFPHAVRELLDAGFWEEDGDRYRIVHQSSYQRSREEVIRMQDSRRANGAKGGRPKKLVREPTRKPSSEATEQPGSRTDPAGLPPDDPWAEVSEAPAKPTSEATGSGQVWSGTEPSTDQLQPRRGGRGKDWRGKEDRVTAQPWPTVALPGRGVVDIRTGELDSPSYLPAVRECGRCGGQGCSDCEGSMEWVQ